MGQAVGRMALFIVLLGFGIFIGVSLASKGVEQIYGPLTADGTTGQQPGSQPGQVGTNANQPSGQHASKPATDTSTPPSPASAPPPALQIPPPDGEYRENWLNIATRKTGSLIQITADHAIRLTVSLFEKLL